jgi:hypothetical protein
MKQESSDSPLRGEWRRGKPGESPTEGNVDELLTEIPEGEAPGSIDGYRAGSRMRLWIFGGLIVGTIGLGIAAHQWVEHLEDERATIVPHYIVDEESAARAVRELHWAEGPARLGLSREPPGVEVIVLPDHEIRLADGHDHAQVKVLVRDGKTVDIKVLSGKIELKEVEAPTPAEPATPP